MKPIHSTLRLLFLFLICNGNAQSVHQDIEKKIDSLFAEYNSGTAGVVIAIVQDGKTIYEKGYGMANLEYGIPITPKTVFHVASVSKQFTAFSIYLLEHQGKISFDDDIRKYIPELPTYGKPIRIKHLLSHTSGLRDQWALLTLAGWQMEDVITTEQILKQAFRQKELNFETGTAFGYCNTGYTLLAEAVERITGQTFAAFTRQNIFEPLEMTNTQFYDDFHKIVKNRAYSYETRDGQIVKKELHYSNVGATSLMTTVEDLAKWAGNFQHVIIGNPELIKQFNKVSTLDNNEPVIWAAIPNDTTYHAKGQLHWIYKGLSVISHGGHDAGFRAVLMRFPENGLSIITLSNNEHYPMLQKVLPVADLFLSGQFKETPDESEAVRNNNNDKEQKKYSNTLADFAGLYSSDELNTEYLVKVVNGGLVMIHQRLTDITLTEVGKDKFSGANTFAFEMDFLRSGRNVVGFEISNFGAKRVKFRKTKS